MKNIKFIFKYTEGHRNKIIMMAFSVIIYCAVLLVNPLLLQYTIDHVLNDLPINTSWMMMFTDFFGGMNSVRDHLWYVGVVIVILNVLSGFAHFWASYSIGSFSEYFSENLRNDVFDHLQKLPYAYHVRAKTGDLIQRCTSDVDQIVRFLKSKIQELVYAVTMVVIALTVLFRINAKMTWITMISFPFIFGFAFLFFKKMQAVFKKSDEAEASLSNTFQESMDAVRVVKAFNQEQFEVEKFEVKNKEYASITKEMIRLLGVYWGTSDLLCFMQTLIVLIASIFEVRAGNLTVGNAIVFISYVNMVLWPIRNVGRTLSDMGKVSVSIDRLNEILELPIENLESGLTPDIQGEILFDNVSFKYDDASTPILKNLNFKINPGETVAIMGPTGSGKSSLVHLLTRIYDVTSGTIRIDGIDINDISKSYLRKNVGLVLQEPYLYSKTLFENIRIAIPHASEQDVYDASRVASIHDVITSFDLGYETPVGEKGVTLSGGQKQRVAIARTLIANTPILIFDDSLSALDSQTDASIRESLNHTKNATSIIITHRINSAQNADKIIVVLDGEIKQIGTHDSLLEVDGLYRNIYDIQTNQKGGALYEL
ncbi:ABC transporter ATP-binding protein [Erysipelothrix rhusiopathiae]|nr:ABC transporter ATP-binding protein [Erysipelothrix rhusiopathiae]MDE8099314.1 ABC transporter ATP-binding protein [Erysipelothrix rhusiopathiae]MDE8145404.1 ABC transporter ATP-binding protein [Erysipelothrix rhusiopathiae]MDE8216717.1 ABC transporter ATP-binding protein [Erysipelothrix rhusiopathiae]MDE8294566.1 ABC transporter ATP-binding protein [Erysipelothrix rhusiopathiae]